MARRKEVPVRNTANFAVVERNADGSIATARLYGQTWYVGQRVVSNGRFIVAAGEAGIITKIEVPGTEGRTSDVLLVGFPHLPMRPTLHMKPIDLRPPTTDA